MSSSMAIPVRGDRSTAHEPLSQSLSSDSGGKGSDCWLDTSSRTADMPTPDKVAPVNDGVNLTRKESYKAQRKNYRREKKRVANELLSSLKDPSVIIVADWLKVRGTLKSWTKLWCVLKPGLLLLYKSPKLKSSHWVGTVLLNACQVIERPSKKDGFCFKVFHPLEQSIWAPKGPEKETLGAVVMPLPTSYLIFRASSPATGKCWLDALELGLRCSTLIVRSSSGRDSGSHMPENSWEYEQHFTDQDITEERNQGQTFTPQQMSTHHLHSASDTESDVSDLGKHDLTLGEVDDEPEHTPYVENEEEEFGSAGEQVEELADENKSLIWYLMKQVRPGMDLSKVVLPTFILEPRSFLDKLSDSNYHADILSQAVLEEDAFTRMKTIVRWYMSGLYKKPKGLKKPYNPVLGESFRCYWKNPNGSKTFYLAEQVSHHPPVSAFYVTNRQDGFCISASILAKSKFYGNSTSAILEGVAILTLLPRGEDYTLTIPYAHCKGILLGTLTMELGGKVSIECEKTGYKTEIEFKLKPLIGGAENMNAICGRLKLGKETLATIDGYWDGNINIRDRRTGEETLLWSPTPEIRSQRLKQYTVPLQYQSEFESERLWQHVSAAIIRDDQEAATEEKTVLEEAQRAAVKERKSKGLEWTPKYFERDLISGQWIYKHSDLRPWDTRNDLFQYEHNYIIQTKTRHKTPMIRTSSIVSVDPQTLPLLSAEGRELKLAANRRRGLCRDSGSSTPDGHSESSHSDSGHGSHLRLQTALQPIEQVLSKHSQQLEQVQSCLRQLVQVTNRSRVPMNTKDTLMLLMVFGLIQAVTVWFLLIKK